MIGIALILIALYMISRYYFNNPETPMFDREIGRKPMLFLGVALLLIGSGLLGNFISEAAFGESGFKTVFISEIGITAVLVIAVLMGSYYLGMAFRKDKSPGAATPPRDNNKNSVDQT
ncbi:MAG: hypothetical protein ACLFR2_08150 [Candidatus Kapaibacterium sp.]